MVFRKKLKRLHSERSTRQSRYGKNIMPKKNNLTSFTELKDELFGKRGTASRDEYERALRIDLEKPPFVSVDWDEFSIAIHKLIRAGELLYLDNTVENKINWIWCDQEIRRVNLGRPRIKS